MTVLCGTDFSPMAHATSRVAAGMARKMGESLHLVHVLEGDDPEGGRLEAEAEALRQAGTEVKAEVAQGIQDEVLLDRARREGVRLLVLGAQGRRAPARWLLGSVAERAVQGSSVPVLVVREPELLESWLLGERHLRVMVATDLSDSSRRALAWIKELRQLGSCEVTVVHVAWLPGEFARLGIGGPMALDDISPELHQILLRDLEQLVSEVPGVGPVHYLIRPGLGRADVDLARLAEEDGANLLVLGAQQRGGLNRWWHGSVARGALVQAATNVAVVPLSSTPVNLEAPTPALRRLLVGTDLSETGDAAVAHGFGFVAAGGTVHLVHVRRPGGQDEAELREALRALVADRAAERRLTVELHVVEGLDAAEALMATAERLGVDAVCVGSAGRGGVKAALVGSVAQRLLAECARTVVLVRPARPA